MKYQFVFLALAFLVSSTLGGQEIGAHAVSDVGFDAEYFPSDNKDRYGIIVLGGSGGGKETSLATAFSEMGYPVLSLAYFDKRGDGTIPKSLELIPLEYVDAAKDWLINREDTRNDGVIIYGISKGAELALILAARDAQYKGVIATAPSSVVWSGIPQNAGDDYTGVSSSWSENGKPLPFIPYVNRSEFRNDEENRMLDWHIASLDRADDFASAMIRVGNIKASLLLFSGGEDGAWPSNEMAASVCAIAAVSNSTVPCTHVNYENAPHTLGDKEPAARAEMGKFLELINQ